MKNTEKHKKITKRKSRRLWLQWGTVRRALLEHLHRTRTEHSTGGRILSDRLPFPRLLWCLLKNAHSGAHTQCLLFNPTSKECLSHYQRGSFTTNMTVSQLLPGSVLLDTPQLPNTTFLEGPGTLQLSHLPPSLLHLSQFFFFTNKHLPRSTTTRPSAALVKAVFPTQILLLSCTVHFSTWKMTW